MQSLENQRNDLKERMEKAKKTNTFMLNYVNKPCTVICFVMLMFNISTNGPMAVFFGIMFIFNLLACFFQQFIIDKCTMYSEALEEHMRMERVRSLRPNRPTDDSKAGGSGVRTGETKGVE